MCTTSSSAPSVRRALVTFALVSVLAPAAVAEGQVAPRTADDARRHATQCRTAARVLSTGTPRRRLAWAHRTILNCGDAAPAALSAATRRLSASRDTAELIPLLRAASFVGDAGFFDAALEVAGMAGASPEARAVGLLVAAMQTTDRTAFDLADLLAADGPMTGCVGGHSDHSLRLPADAPLPADAGARLRAAIARVSASPNEPLLVQNAARCASAVSAAAHDGTASGALFDELARLDSLLFDAFFVRCDAQKTNSFFTDDLEFYHDLTGAKIGQTARDAFKQCPRDGGGTRKLVAGSLRVYPIKDYGAVQTGVHRFGETEAKFVHLWQRQASGEWKITRVLSFDHRPMAR